MAVHARHLRCPVGDLGLILLVSTVGSVVVTAFVGPLIRRLGVPALLAVAGVLAALGYAGFAAAPSLWLVLGVAVLLGLSAGMMDGGLNTAVALTGRACSTCCTAPTAWAPRSARWSSPPPSSPARGGPPTCSRSRST